MARKSHVRIVGLGEARSQSTIGEPVLEEAELREGKCKGWFVAGSRPRAAEGGMATPFEELAGPTARSRAWKTPVRP